LKSVKDSQVGGILGGLPGVRPVKQVMTTAASMLTEPFKSYPRVLHGMRNSAKATAQVTAVEFFNVLTAVTVATQSSLEFAQGIPEVI
jgi:hypothetical protein